MQKKNGTINRDWKLMNVQLYKEILWHLQSWWWRDIKYDAIEQRERKMRKKWSDTVQWSTEKKTKQALNEPIYTEIPSPATLNVESFTYKFNSTSNLKTETNLN